MAGASKSTKNADTVPSLDQFRAPWETETGSEAEIDKPKLKRYIHSLHVDKAKAQDSRDDALAEVSTLTAANADLKARAESSDGKEAAEKIAKLEKQNSELSAKVKGFEDAAEESKLRQAVLGDLPAKFSKYVTGKTESDLKASLKQVAEDFNFKLDKDGKYDPQGQDEDDDEEPTLRRQPRANLRNLSDPEPDDGNQEVDFEAVAAQIVGNRVL